MRSLCLLILLAACDGGVPLDSKDTSGGDTSGTERYHPEGWADPTQHGLGAKLRSDDCQSCHGETLDGGTGVSCDSCHAEGWRTDCTFCHGGDDNSTGAPPQDIDDSSTDISFAAHTAHVVSDLHPDYDCVQCHTQPEDVLSSGHLFNDDDTKGVAEVTFAGGLSTDGGYAGNGSCSNLYCHGDGDNTPGGSQDGDSMTCTTCHGGVDDDWSGLGGEHSEHRRQGVDCEECHGDTTSTGSDIKTADLHVNGQVDLKLGGDVVWSGGECTGSCHDEKHGGADW